MLKDSPIVSNLQVSVFTVPTDFPESDGTLEWDSTTMILVEIAGGGKTGIGYTYGNACIARFIDKTLRETVTGCDCFNIPEIRAAMIAAVRNDGKNGLVAMGISAVDCALWDLKAKLLDLPLAVLWGMKRSAFPVYGSGGFTSYSIERLQKQLAAWTEQGILQVKMKVGRDPGQDVYRVKMARTAIGMQSRLFVDGNGAYTVKQALDMAQQFSDAGVTWFEEPVPSADLDGLYFIRDHAPAQMIIAAGEYGDSLDYFKRMLEAKAVDVLQADVTRCGGLSAFLQTGCLCEAHRTLYSSHCAPSLHLHAGLALAGFYIGEYFHDHVRIENMFFDGVPRPQAGALHADLSRPGLGLQLKKQDMEKYKL